MVRLAKVDEDGGRDWLKLAIRGLQSQTVGVQLTTGLMPQVLHFAFFTIVMRNNCIKPWTFKGNL